jgi:hypothetical protein
VSSFFNFLIAMLMGAWVKTDSAGYKMINYALCFLLLSFFYHLHQIHEHCVLAGRRAAEQLRFKKNSELWGALRDCVLSLVLLPMGTYMSTVYFSMVCWVVIAGCTHQNPSDTKPMTCFLIGVRFAAWACQKCSLLLGLCALMFGAISMTFFSASKSQIVGVWLYPALAIVPLAASRMG